MASSSGLATFAHKGWEDPGEQGFTRFLKKNKLESEDLDTALSVAHAHSHTLFGGNKVDSFKLLGDLSDDDLNMARTVQATINELNLGDLTGRTPMEKGASFAKLVKNEGGMEQIASHFKYDPKGAMKRIEKMAEKAEAMKTIARNEFAAEAGIWDKNKSNEDNLIELDQEQQRIMRALSRLSTIGKIQFGSIKKKVRQDDGPIQIPEQMDSLFDVLDIDIVEFAYPDFYARLSQYDYTVQKQWDDIMIKQEIALAIDRSGSMSYPKKQAYVKALLLHLFDGVKKGDTIVYVTFYEYDYEPYVKISTLEEALEFYNNFPEPNGGGTDMGKVITETQQMIKEGRISDHILTEGSEPQLLLCNDGQDHLRPTLTVAPMHAISLGIYHTDLEKLCLQSGGSFNVFLKDFDPWS